MTISAARKADIDLVHDLDKSISYIWTNKKTISFVLNAAFFFSDRYTGANTQRSILTAAQLNRYIWKLF